MDAVLNDRSSQIQALLDTNKLDVHFRYGRAKRGLCHTAASFGAYQCLRLLAARGCDINQRDVGNLTPIMLAARNGHSATVSLLVKELHAGAARLFVSQGQKRFSTRQDLLSSSGHG